MVGLVIADYAGSVKDDGMQSESVKRVGEGEVSTLTESCDTARESGTISVLGAFINVTKVNWGIGMMSMPFYLASAGLYLGLIFFIVSMLLTYVSVMRLMKCKDALEQRQGSRVSSIPFSELMGAGLGKFGRYAAFFSIAIANWGSCVAYMKWLGDNMHKFGPMSGLLSSADWVGVISVPLALAVFFVDNVTWLQPFSSFGLLMGQAFTVIILVTAATSLGQPTQSFSSFIQNVPAVNWRGFPVAMGIAVFCNEGMVIMSPQVQGQMKQPQRYHYALMAMGVYFTANYMAVAVAGYYLFAPKPSSEMTLDFATDHQVLRVAVIIYAGQLVMSYILVLFIVYSSVEPWLASLAPETFGGRRGRLLLKAGRLVQVGLASLIAIWLPNFGDFVALGGAIGNTLGIYLLPHWMFLRMADRDGLRASRSERFGSWCIIFFGIVSGSVAAVVSFDQLVSARTTM